MVAWRGALSLEAVFLETRVPRLARGAAQGPCGFADGALLGSRCRHPLLHRTASVRHLAAGSSI